MYYKRIYLYVNMFNYINNIIKMHYINDFSACLKVLATKTQHKEGR